MGQDDYSPDRNPKRNQLLYATLTEFNKNSSSEFSVVHRGNTIKKGDGTVVFVRSTSDEEVGPSTLFQVLLCQMDVTCVYTHSFFI